jgi:DNA helicase-2/ATP-dependent DNA helicase PcrA
VGEGEGHEDTDAESGESVVLSSVHQAKGLEWRVVFVTWLAEERFPSGLALREDENDEEERRLFYVAVTRAKEALYLCYPLLELGRNQTGVFTTPSRFIRELPESAYESWAIEEDITQGSLETSDGKQDAESEQEGISQAPEKDDWDQYFEDPGPAVYRE